MKSYKKSPSERFVSAVIGFVAERHMWGKPRPSTFSLMLEARQLSRMTRELRKKYGLDERRR